ncbi:unnamed protein product, partial [Fusarium langsethiae]
MPETSESGRAYVKTHDGAETAYDVIRERWDTKGAPVSQVDDMGHLIFSARATKLVELTKRHWNESCRRARWATKISSHQEFNEDLVTSKVKDKKRGDPRPVGFTDLGLMFVESHGDEMYHRIGMERHIDESKTAGWDWNSRQYRVGRQGQGVRVRLGISPSGPVDTRDAIRSRLFELKTILIHDMEHLIYNLSARSYRREIRAATNGPLDIDDWDMYDKQYGTCPSTSCRISWLGHDHAASSYYHSSENGPQPPQHAFINLYGMEWSLDNVFSQHDMRLAHPMLHEVDTETAVHRVAAFIQSWLYFGLLEAIVEMPISSSFMVRTGDDGKKYLYSRTLPLILGMWTRWLYTLSSEARDSNFRMARDCAVRANSILSEIIDDASALEHEGPFLELKRLLFSTEPALSALHEGIARTVEHDLNLEIRSFSSLISPFPKPYSENLIRKGWCRFIIASAEIAMSPSLLRYIDVGGLMPNSRGHEFCTGEQCERNQINPQTYTQKHTTVECNCHFLKPDIGVVLEILDAGYFPVVKLAEDAQSFEIGGVHLEDSHSEYIAFSHVWADGLGSCTENGLPACQVRRLDQLARERCPYGAYFWIDSLCIPEAPDQKQYRKKAIRSMNVIYQNAHGVIILDTGLRNLSSRNSQLEIGWSVFASGWFGRLWTYQEGFLPRRVDLELDDCLFDLDVLIKSLYQQSGNPRGGNIFPFIFVRDLVAMLQKTRPVNFDWHQRPWSNRLVDAFNVLTRRRSSRSDDQIIVISLMLDLDLESLLNLEGEEKWRKFYISLGTIPWTIMFDERSKMPTSPFTWAPATWISSGKDKWLHYEDDLAEITEQGLKVTLTVLRLETPCFSDLDRIVVHADDQFYDMFQSKNTQPAKVKTFNVVFIRYFKNESPSNALQRDNLISFYVGIGLKSWREGSQLQHDFNQSLEIRGVSGISDIAEENPRVFK